jgi:hypothetical protein
MGKLSAGFDLGTELRALRKASRLTQAALAAKADLAERTVRALFDGVVAGGAGGPSMVVRRDAGRGGLRARIVRS